MPSPWTQLILKELDRGKQAQRNALDWSLIDELTEPRSIEHMRQLENWQTPVTALQPCVFAVFERWRVHQRRVVGHSSSETAAAYAAALLGRDSATLAAFYRRTSINNGGAQQAIGMLALGLRVDNAFSFVEKH